MGTADEELRGEDGGDELIRIADALPGRSAGRVEGSVYVSIHTDSDGTTWRGEAPMSDIDAPIRWTVTALGEYWAGRGVKLGPTDVAPR